MSATPDQSQPKTRKARPKVDHSGAIVSALNVAKERHSTPLTVAQLAESCGLAASEVLAVAKKKGAPFIVVANTATSPCALSEHAGSLAQEPETFQFLAEHVTNQRSVRGISLASNVADFLKDAGIDNRVKPLVKIVLTDMFMRKSLPEALKPLIELPISPDEIASRMLSVIESQKHASETSYPVPATRLPDLAGLVKPPADALKKAFSSPQLTQHVVAYVPRPGDPSTAIRYGLVKDIGFCAAEQLSQAIEIVVISSRTPSKKGNKAAQPTTIFSAGDIAKGFLKGATYQAQFAAEVANVSDEKLATLKVGKLLLKGQSMFFRWGDVQPRLTPDAARIAATITMAEPAKISTSNPNSATVSTAVPDNFASEFDAAFRRVDSRTGARNFLKLAELRRELPNYDRTTFDLGLRQLRIDRRYTLDSAQGGQVQLTSDEIAAGIQEGSSLLIYVTKVN